MLILHCGVIDDELFFWGEKAVPADYDGSKVKPHAPLPADAGEDSVRKILAETLFDGSIRRQASESLTVWLPTCGGVPLPSNPVLVGPLPAGKPGLAPWKVHAMKLSLENAIGFLAACIGKDVLKSGVLIGPDLAFWTRVARFAGALVARQQYLPDLLDVEGEFQAMWDPIFVGTDAEYLEDLARAMPSSCRALTREAGKIAPQTSPITLVSNFIVSMTDFLARYSIFSQPQSTWPKSFRTDDEDIEFDSLHDSWINALVSPEAVMDDDREQLASLQHQIREWRKPISVSTTSPFRLCLALEEPPAGAKDEGENWFVHFFLQSTSQPEVLIPADHVWSPSPAELKQLNPKGFDAKEFLLSSLGQASTICPRIEGALMADAPSGYALDTAGAYEFLQQRAIALDQAGFGTLVPKWWTPTGTRHRLGTRANVKIDPKAAKSGFSLDQVLDFDWEVTLGGESIKRDELTALAKSKVPLVRMRGHWIQIGETEVNDALELTSTKARARGTLRDIVQMALGSSRAPGNFQFEGVRTTGWIADFLKQLEGESTFEELKVPKGLHCELRPYQARGFSWLAFLRQWGLGACLADDMGLGKTVQALALVEHEWEKGNRKPVLVICPTSLTGNWSKEAQRFTPGLPVMVHHGINRAKGAAFKAEAEKQAIVISSYSLLHRDVDVLRKIDWAGVILDEAQNIKNPKTKQARSARAIEAKYRIALTGTPIENNVGDLWSLMEFLNPGFLGTQADFKRSFLTPIQANHEGVVVDRLKKLTAPFILRRLKNDKSIIKDLPEKMEMKVYCTLTKEQAGLYEALVREVEATLDSTDGIQRRGLVLATLTKLKQICNHPAQFLGEGGPLVNRSGKLMRLTEMLEEIIELGERALVFTQFVEMGKIVQQHLQETFGREVLFLHGGVPKKQRDDMIDKFQEDPEGPSVFVLSLKAGGTGLNLTRANHVFHFDRWWNPAVEDQATDRVYRIGQTKNVQIHKFLCAGTLEDKIDDMIEAKKGLAESIVGADENWITELSTTELKKIFELQKDAIGE